MANYFVWALVYVDAINTSDATHAYNNDPVFSDYGGAFGLHLRSGTGITKAQFYHYDGVERIVESDITIGKWTLLQFRYDGVNIRCKVDNGAVQTVSAGAPTAFNGWMQVGRNYNFAQFFDGKLMELGIANSAQSDTRFDDIRTYINAHYGLTL